jgi:RNA binding exosome subunit
MSSKQQIAYIDIRVSAHATEDQQKVQTAIENLISINEFPQPIILQKTACTGHYGNPIVLFTAKLEDKEILPAIIEKIGTNLSVLDKEEFGRNLELHLEKTNLYLRFDKQSALNGVVKFSQIDPIHMRIHFRNQTQQQIAEFLKQKGLLP